MITILNLTLSLIIPICLYPLSDVLAQQSGYYIEEETTTPPLFGMPGQTHLTKTWITENRLRRDDGEKGQTILVQSDKTRFYIIQHKDSTFAELSQAAFQGFAMMGLMIFGVSIDSITGQPVVPDAIFYRTGRKKRIGQWYADEIIVNKSTAGVFSGQAAQVILWVSSETGIQNNLYALMMRKMMGDLDAEYDSFFRQLEAINGYPVEMYTKLLGFEITQKLMKVEKQRIQDSVFQPPEGYHKKNSLFDE